MWRHALYEMGDLKTLGYSLGLSSVWDTVILGPAVPLKSIQWSDLGLILGVLTCCWREVNPLN